MPPYPTPSFSCNNITGFWESGPLQVFRNEEIVFGSPSIVYGDLHLEPGAIAIFRDYNSTWVKGKSYVSSNIVVDFGKNIETGMYYEFKLYDLKSLALIHSKEQIYITGTTLTLRYTGGCTTMHGSLNHAHNPKHPHYPHTLQIANLSKVGTGNCHWIWTTLSFMAILATLIIVPLIEKFVWKVYD